MHRNNNPLSININQRAPAFKKKQQVQIFEDNRQTPVVRNQILNTTNDSMNRSQSFNQTLDNTFLLNQISTNEKLLDRLSEKLIDQVKDQSRLSTEQFVDRKVHKIIKKEINDFKVQLTDFLAKFITKQKNIAQEEQISALKEEINLLKNQNIQPVSKQSSITEERSQILDKEILYIKSNLEVLKANIEDIKENESILEDKINAQLSSMNMANSQLDCNLKRKLKDLRLRKNYQRVIIGIKKSQKKQLQVGDKLNNFKTKVDTKIENLNESQKDIRKEINQYFDLDEQNFSAININQKDQYNQESEMFDIKNLNNELGQSLMRNKNVISAKKDVQMPSDYGFMESKGPVEKQPYVPPTSNNQQKLNSIQEESYSSNINKKKNLMKLNQSQLKESQLDITINDQSVVEYIVDESGYLVDQNGFPIIDDNGKAIKLNDENIEYLKQNKLYEEVYQE